MNILLLTLAFSPALLAQNFKFNQKSGQAVPDHVAELKLMRGNVYRIGKGKRPVAVSIGTLFRKNDTLITEEKSFAKVVMVDDTVLTIGSNSEFTFEDFQYETKEKRNSLVSLVKGQVRALVKHPVKEGELLYKTKNAVMAVRGTELYINHREENSVEISEFALTAGKAEVTDRAKKKVALHKLDRYLVAKDPAEESWVTEKNQLSSEEFKSITGEGEVMPFYEVSRIGRGSDLWPLFSQGSPSAVEDSPAASRPSSSDEEEKGLKHNLDRLNEQLKENQKSTNPFN